MYPSCWYLSSSTNHHPFKYKRRKKKILKEVEFKTSEQPLPKVHKRSLGNRYNLNVFTRGPKQSRFKILQKVAKRKAKKKRKKKSGSYSVKKFDLILHRSKVQDISKIKFFQEFPTYNATKISSSKKSSPKTNCFTTVSLSKY